jgi:hypothetical protein
MHLTLAEDFVHALCRSPDVRYFLVNRRPLLAADEYSYILSVTDIFPCMSYWPRLHRVNVYAFATSSEADETPVPSCTIEGLSMHSGHITGPQLRLLTAPSYLTLRNVDLAKISGLTIEGLGIWLGEFGPVLTSRVLRESTVTRRTDEEEYADAQNGQFAPLGARRRCYYPRTGAVAQAGHGMKRSKKNTASGERSTLSIANTRGVNAHGFVSASRLTEWEQVIARGLFGENTQLKEEA